MQNSAEIRWFWPHPLAWTIESWFRSGVFPPGGGQPRADIYLLNPRQSEIGIKKRGGKQGIEIKGLVARVHDSFKIGPSEAHGELWTKWTTDSLQLDNSAQVTVYKTRWLRKFEIRDVNVREIQLGKDESPSDPNQKLPDEGCNFEFTEVSLTKDGPKSSTVGFESFGPYESVEANLRRVLEHLADTNVPQFDEGEELSYPGWLIEQHLSFPDPQVVR
jgi:hypothetical protein